MSTHVVFSVADWPGAVGTDWYAVGGALGITALVVGALLLVNFFSGRKSGHE